MSFEYTVTWAIQVNADNPKNAALMAQELLKGPDSSATIYEVEGGDIPDSGHKLIDLRDDQDVALQPITISLTRLVKLNRHSRMSYTAILDKPTGKITLFGGHVFKTGIGLLFFHQLSKAEKSKLDTDLSSLTPKEFE